MTYSLINKCAKNYYNRTFIVPVIAKNVVTCFFLRHSVLINSNVLINALCIGANIFCRIDSIKLRDDVKNQIPLTFAKFGVDLINTFKVTSCKTKWPRF